jgi:hypothetical protein
VSVTDANGCSDSDDVEVIVNPLPIQPEVTANGSDLESTSGISYQWYLDGNPINGANSPIYTPTTSGNYSVEVFDSNGCSSISDEYTWITVGVDEYDSVASVYPNPFTSQLTIELNERVVQIEIMDATGKLIRTYYPNSYLFEINTASWSGGLYNLRIATAKSTIFKKVIKVH